MSNARRYSSMLLLLLLLLHYSHSMTRTGYQIRLHDSSPGRHTIATVNFEEEEGGYMALGYHVMGSYQELHLPHSLQYCPPSPYSSSHFLHLWNYYSDSSCHRQSYCYSCNSSCVPSYSCVSSSCSPSYSCGSSSPSSDCCYHCYCCCYYSHRGCYSHCCCCGCCCCGHVDDYDCASGFFCSCHDYFSSWPSSRWMIKH